MSLWKWLKHKEGKRKKANSKGQSAFFFDVRVIVGKGGVWGKWKEGSGGCRFSIAIRIVCV